MGLRELASLEGRIDRRTYLQYGLLLAVLKYLGDAAIVALFASIFWSPFNYLRWPGSFASFPIELSPTPLMPSLALWTLPFMWAGVSLTLRRARDAGLSPWLSLVFFVPYLNYVLMATLCIFPTSPHVSDEPAVRDSPRLGGGMVTGSLVGIVLGLACSAIIANLTGSYGPGLFFGAPFTVGAISGFIATQRGDHTNLHLLVITSLIVAVSAVAMIGAGQEGLICILMALPILLVAAFLGSMIGRALAVCRELGLAAVIPVLLVPGGVELGTAHHLGTALHEVRSEVEIAAMPEDVWPHVVAFSDLSEPTEVLFRLGIAYPKRATISGSGVGAIRYCVFSTGAFVEPITVWDRPRRLSFDVTSSPAPLRELSPYASVSPPHLDNYLRAKRGEFRLVPLANGHTRLEGSTWYQIQMAPEGYWQVYADALIRQIHHRVLDHIRHEVEAREPTKGRT